MDAGDDASGESFVGEMDRARSGNAHASVETIYEARTRRDSGGLYFTFLPSFSLPPALLDLRFQLPRALYVLAVIAVAELSDAGEEVLHVFRAVVLQRWGGCWLSWVANGLG